MMKNTLVLIFFFVGISVSAQNFEGKITYQNTNVSKIEGVTSYHLNAMMGTVQEYYIKGSNYKTIMNGQFSQMQVYSPSKNRLYSKVSMTDTLLWDDCSINAEEVVDYYIEKSEEVVLGYKCKVLIVETKTSKTSYYFSKKIKLDADAYVNHLYGNWNIVTSQTKALPLKTIIESDQINHVGLAVQIEKMDLDDSFFDLPDLPSKLNPYN